LNAQVIEELSKTVKAPTPEVLEQFQNFHNSVRSAKSDRTKSRKPKVQPAKTTDPTAFLASRSVMDWLWLAVSPYLPRVWAAGFVLAYYCVTQLVVLWNCRLSKGEKALPLPSSDRRHVKTRRAARKSHRGEKVWNGDTITPIRHGDKCIHIKGSNAKLQAH
jgi:hypothetical protein